MYTHVILSRTPLAVTQSKRVATLLLAGILVVEDVFNTRERIFIDQTRFLGILTA